MRCRKKEGKQRSALPQPNQSPVASGKQSKSEVRSQKSEDRSASRRQQIRGTYNDDKIRQMFKWIRVIVFLSCVSALAQGPQNILLVVNQNSQVSKQVSEYYLHRRRVPAAQVCAIKAPEEKEVDRATFDDSVRLPILDCLSKGRLEDRVLYIVLTKGVPLKIKPSGRPTTQASVDSELTLLYQDLLGIPRVLEGTIPNPYFVRTTRRGLVRFSHREFPMYLVTRLDGYDMADISALIDRAQSPSRQGQFVLDLDDNDNRPGNAWLREAADRLRALGIPPSRITLDTTPAFLTGQKNVLGYASWGSNDHSDRSRFLGNTWVNGAILAEFVSTDARTFTRPPKDWNIGRWSDSPITFYDRSPQSLIADYIHEGVTGAAGNVYEPYLGGNVRPQILFPAYVQGLNLAESYWAAMPYLSWQTVVVGDPLTAPFAGVPLPAAEADPPLDSTTKLPKYFAQWKEMARKRAP